MSVVLIPWNHVDRAITRVLRDLAPSLRYYPTWKFEIIVVDNSTRELHALRRAVEALPWPSQYLWQRGKNLLYGPSLNLAARVARHASIVYACAEHGRMIDPRWLGDIVGPLRTDAAVAMTGHVVPSPFPARHFGLRYAGRRIHVQGGVFAARTDVLRRHPYDAKEYAHACSDILQSYQLLAAGFQLIDVPSIMSVWRSIARPGPWRYVHDNAEG